MKYVHKTAIAIHNKYSVLLLLEKRVGIHILIKISKWENNVKFLYTMRNNSVIQTEAYKIVDILCLLLLLL